MEGADFTIVILLLIVLASLAGMSLYYQSTYGGVTARYEMADAELQNALEVIQEREITLNATLAEVNAAQQLEQTLGGNYTEVKAAKESTEAQLNRTLKELGDLKAENARLVTEISYTQDKVKEAQAIIEQYSADNINLKATISVLQNDIQVRDAQIASLDAQVQALQKSHSLQ